MGDALSTLGDTTFDIYLYANAFWRNVPAVVWRYKLAGHEFLKKWFLYRERGVLGRALKPEELGFFCTSDRRILSILTLEGGNTNER